MKKSVKSSREAGHHRDINPKSKNPAIATGNGPKKSYSRAAWILAALSLGFYFIETHRTLGQCSFGLVLWGLAIFWTLPWFPDVQGLRVFSTSILQDFKGREAWNWAKVTLVSVSVLAVLALCEYFIQRWFGLVLLVSLLVLGWLLALLGNHSPAFWMNPAESDAGRVSPFPWPAFLITLVGLFFLFYGWDIFPIGKEWDCCATMELCNSFLKPDGRTSPYVDGWSPGNPSLPFFIMGLFFKLVGSSQVKGVFFNALGNLAGFLFFYGFLRFYLSRGSALATTLLFSSSYWILYFARETYPVSLLVPFESTALFFFARALEKGKARDYAIFGTLMAGLLMLCISSVALVGFFAISLVGIGIYRSKEVLAQKSSWALAGGVFLLWYFPMLLYYHHMSNPYGFFAGDEIARDKIWQGNQFFVPWYNIHIGFQMFFVRTTDFMTEFLPRLSPWEGLFLLAGLGWCLWRFLSPIFFMSILGLMMCLAPAIVSNNPTLPWRPLAAAPFVYLLVGIGLDRLGRAVAAPLGSRGGFMRFFFLSAFLLFSIGWQYDVFFHQLPRDKNAYWGDWAALAGQRYLVGKTTAQYMRGWDTYVDTIYGVSEQIVPEGGFSYSQKEVQESVWNRKLFRMDRSPLPLKNVPQKGAVILLHDQIGEALQDWISFYYPDAKSKVIMNPFGDVEIRLWEITPGEVQKALSLPQKPLPGGMFLSWYDSKNRQMGRWLIPTLSSKILTTEWFTDNPEVGPPFPWDKVDHFILEGNLLDADGSPLTLETTGQADGVFNGIKIHLSGNGNLTHLDLKVSPGRWEPFKIRYKTQKQGEFSLDLRRHLTPGWDMVPSSELRP